MIKPLFLSASLALVAVGPSLAQDSSFQIKGAIGAWSNQYGGNGFESVRGLDGEYSRFAADVGLSYAVGISHDLTAVAALSFGHLSPAEKASVQDEDATKSTADVTFRLLREQGSLTYGAFIGGGSHEDYGDSDKYMSYRYLGGELAKETDFGGYYVQIGYLDSNDEYDEGTRDAPFINVGGSYKIDENYTLTGALGYAGGKKYDGSSDNKVVNLTVGVERSLGDYSVSFGYEATQISYSDGADRYGDTFGNVFVGFKYEFGGTAKHGSPLPKLSNWVALNANEIEQP